MAIPYPRCAIEHFTIACDSDAMRFPAILLLLLTALRIHGSPAEADRISRTYQLSSESWELKMKLAATDAEKQALLAKRPDPTATAKELWRAIATSLTEDWTIPHAGFFLNHTRALTQSTPNGIAPAFVEERKLIIATFSKHHLRKPGIGPFAIALADTATPEALPMLEKIIAENPDKATQGLAALGASMILRNLGDGPEIMSKRLTHLRNAIIHAADQKLGETSVADIAANELYVIKNLSKGRTAPDFAGTDVAGRNVTLSASRGKVTVVLFWDAKSTDTDRIIDFTNELVIKNTDKPVHVIGITPESLQRIRELQGDGSIRWNNIIDPAEKITGEYRVNSRPLVFVLDKDGRIEYTGLPGSFVDLTVDALLSPPPAEKR
jgi:peroxiredoxin